MQAIKGVYQGKDILAIKQFDKADIKILFAEADRLRKEIKKKNTLTLQSNKIMANVFYEPSTRTSSSFIAAIQRLGGGFIPINDVRTSSVSKGETLADTVHTLEQYADVIILRHPGEGQALAAANAAQKPIINAGDGVGEHPTQALLDLYTILREHKKIDGLTVTLLGDTKNGRCMHSLAELLSLYKVKLNYVSPASLKMPKEIVQKIARRGIVQHETTDLEEVIDSSDVVYVTRMQQERFDSKEAYEAVKRTYTITPDTMKRAKKDMVLIHTLPRVAEIDVAVDDDPRAAYFRQVKNGMYVRMALLNLVLGGSKE